MVLVSEDHEIRTESAVHSSPAVSEVPVRVGRDGVVSGMLFAAGVVYGTDDLDRRTGFGGVVDGGLYCGWLRQFRVLLGVVLG